jgi:signal transduction histidine kinase
MHATLDLPVSQPPVTPNQRPVLLIVDDEAGPRESLRMVFKDRYQCMTAINGTAGIEYARQHHVDAAILDIRMPDMTGIDVLRELKAIDQHIECIMLTGYETVETARAAVHHGASDYLNKPFDVFAMRELLERCLNRRRQREELEQNVEQLRQLNAELSTELAQADRSATAGVLSAGVVHELNNPLAIVSAYAQLLNRDLAVLQQGDLKAVADAQQRLTAIQHEVERCADIAHRFLRFSRVHTRETECLEAGRLLEDTAALLKAHPANQQAQILVGHTGHSLPVEVHPGEMMQILLNLGINALQAMNGDGTLRLTAERVATAPTEFAFRAPAFDAQRPLVRLTVSDTGAGLAPGNREKLFTPYFSTKANGNGLGLALVAELVGRHGGAIGVESEPGVATKFSVYLPLAL